MPAMRRLSGWLLARLKGRDHRYVVLGVVAAVVGWGVWAAISVIGKRGPINSGMLVTLYVCAQVLILASVLLFIAGAVRRNRINARIDAGLCGNCGYDLRAHDEGERCPECGSVSP